MQHERYWAEAGRTYFLANDTKVQSAYAKAQEIVAAMAQQLKPNGAVAAIDETARKALGEFYATASVYGLANGIGLNQWEAPFLSESDAREVGASSVGATTLNEDMTLALARDHRDRREDRFVRRQFSGDGGWGEDVGWMIKAVKRDSSLCSE